MCKNALAFGNVSRGVQTHVLSDRRLEPTPATVMGSALADGRDVGCPQLQEACHHSGTRFAIKFEKNDPGRTRTCNPRLRRPMPYPLGHGARCIIQVALWGTLLGSTCHVLHCSATVCDRLHGLGDEDRGNEAAQEQQAKAGGIRICSWALPHPSALLRSTLRVRRHLVPCGMAVSMESYA